MLTAVRMQCLIMTYACSADINRLEYSQRLIHGRTAPFKFACNLLLSFNLLGSSSMIIVSSIKSLFRANCLTLSLDVHISYSY